MTLPAPTYDLTLVLDPRVEEGARAKIVADALASVKAKGELLRHDDWGERPLAYPIRRSASGEYHLLQFHVGDKTLLAELAHTLHITDGILRFRIIKLRPGVPEAPAMAPAQAAPRTAPADDAPAAAQAPAPAAAQAPAPGAGEEQGAPPAPPEPVGDPA